MFGITRITRDIDFLSLLLLLLSSENSRFEALHRSVYKSIEYELIITFIPCSKRVVEINCCRKVKKNDTNIVKPYI